MKEQPNYRYGMDATASSADNAAVTHTFAAAEGIWHVLDRVDAGFDVKPAAAVLIRVQVDGVTVWEVPIVEAGIAPMPFHGDEKPATGEGGLMTVVLDASGTAGRTGYLNTLKH